MVREGVDYIARTNSETFTEGKFLNAFIDQLASEHPEAVKLLEVGTDKNYRVYSVDRAKLAAAFGKDDRGPLPAPQLPSPMIHGSQSSQALVGNREVLRSWQKTRSERLPLAIYDIVLLLHVESQLQRSG